jgi:signal transduction histidine kinase
MPYPIDPDVEFFAKIAHEIRQPLTPMQSALQLLKKCEDTQVREHACRALERQIDHMSHLLDDLIGAVALGRTALEVRRARFDLREVIDEAIDTVKPIASEFGQRLDVSLPTNAVWIDADPLRLRQVVSNLLSNAFTHTRAGERVWVQIQQDRARVSLVVADNGRGIPDGSLRRIFDPFTQAENSASGFGLGLAIVKQLVELQGGTVEAFSAGLERGSRFVVSLPPPMVANHVITSAARLLPQSQC